MRRALGLGLVLLLVAGSFYVAWPAWTGRQIAQAIDANDPAALEQHIDFGRVRARVKPVFAQELERRAEELKREAGPLGAVIAGQLQSGLGSSLAQAAIDSLLTPQNVIAMVRQGRDLRRVLQQVPGPRFGAGGNGGGGSRLPGVRGAQAGEANEAGGAPDAGVPEGRRRLTLSNIKSYRVTGPLAIAIEVGRDPNVATAEATIEMEFVGTGWQVVGIVPRF